MPLSPSMSKSEIIKKEMEAGKPQKQAVAIAYSVHGESRDDEHCEHVIVPDMATYNVKNRDFWRKLSARKSTK